MTTSSDQPPVPETPPEETAPTEEESPPTETGESTPAEQPEEGDGLPEVEPLTPELVEDEAIRGDFMLRAFVLVLAVLLASTEIAETTTLVHVKTGQYLMQDGWLPGGKDVFSYTAKERPWINLSWLFDLKLAGVYAAGGDKLLTVFKAGLVAIAFWLVLWCVRPGVSTWWGSITAALALLTCHPQFTALPELVTLLGVAVVLWVLHRWRSSEANRNTLWWLVPTFILWSNLDNRMFLGLALLFLFATGEAVGSLLRHSGTAQSERRRQLWIVLAACLLAACLNPFGWNSLTEPLRLYGIEYPTHREYYAGSPSAVDLQNFSLLNWSVMKRPHVVAGLVLLTATLVTFFLNRRQMSYGQLFMVFGFAGFAVAASHELAAAAVVACVVGTLNGQDWYRETFSQVYTIELKERMFSNGGRAVTVLALFFVAFLAASGRLSDPAQRRIGLGFHPDLQARITGLREDTADLDDNRSFHFVLRQGDLLIWLERDVFIDSRVDIYSGTGDEDLASLHRRTRQSLRGRTEGVPLSGRDEIWQATFDQFQITHVLPRLSGSSPDYVTLFSLRPPNWEMIRLGSMTAVIYRTDTRTKDVRLDEYLRKRSLDLIDEAFRKEAPESEPRVTWPQPRSTYQTLLSKSRHTRPVSVQTAMHYNRYLQEFQTSAAQVGVLPPYSAATAHLAIRHANQGLAEDPECADAFDILGDAYLFLNQLETSICRNGGGSYDSTRRYRQTIAAYNQAVLLEPDRASAHFGLFLAYQIESRKDRGSQKLDLAVRALRRFQALTDYESDPSEAVQARQTELLMTQNQLQAQVETQLRQIDIRLASPGFDVFQVSQFAYSSGCVLRALELLEQDPSLLAGRPDAQLYLALMLNEVGRVEEAEEKFLSLEGVAAQIGLMGWQGPAAWSKLANANYKRAIELWTSGKNSLINQHLTPILVPLALDGPNPLWTPFHSQAASTALQLVGRQAGQALVEIALSHLEAGRNSRATEAFQQAIKIDPHTGNRPLIRFYLLQLTGEAIDLFPPEEEIPLEPHEMFTPEPDAEPPPKTGA